MKLKISLLLISLLLTILSIWAIFYYAPVEETMGLVQKIFYFHVASAWTGFFAFGLVFIFSILFLAKKKSNFDTVAHCSAEIGIIFTSLVLLTGPFWAKPVWNTWWTWDPRLTTTLILLFIYIGYLLLRKMIDSPEKSARIAAVYGIIGFVDVPIVYFSIRLWRTLHPEHVIMGGQNSGLDPRMFHVLMLSLVSFSLLFFSLLLIRLETEKIKNDLNILKRSINQSH